MEVTFVCKTGSPKKLVEGAGDDDYLFRFHRETGLTRPYAAPYSDKEAVGFHPLVFWIGCLDTDTTVMAEPWASVQPPRPCSIRFL